MSDPVDTGKPGHPSPAELLDEEARLQLPHCSDADALWIGRWLLASAESRDLACAIEVWRGQRLIFRAARAGTNGHNDVYLAGKRRVVEHFGHSSFYERRRHEVNGSSFEAATSFRFPEFAPHGGGVPLIVRGTGPVGVALVSGLPMEADHALVVEALEAFLAANPD
jgi:uncharacterized protein (UPF0303 family)